MNQLQEHIFLQCEEISISSTRIVLENKTIAASAICSIELDKEEVKPPFLIMWAALFSVLIGAFSRTSYLRETGWGFAVFFIFIFLIVWVIRNVNRKEAVIIELSSGDSEYIDNKEISNLQEVFNALNQVIIFRG